MKKSNFYFNYFSSIFSLSNEIDEDKLENCVEIISKCNENKNKVIIVGNGGSASIASHVAIDLTKAAKIRSVNFNESSLLTCFSNDYGYENWVSNALKAYADNGDVVILISSSGMSANIINGAKQANSMGLKLITLSGFSEKNSLKSLGNINLWLNSSNYNFVETVHQIWLLSIIDKIIEMQKK